MIPVKQKHRFLKQFLISVLIAAFSLSSVAQTGRVHLPELGNSASDVLSNAEEREYAAGLIRQMRAYELLNEDPLISGFFSDMGYNLAAVSDQPEAAFTFVVLDQPVGPDTKPEIGLQLRGLLPLEGAGGSLLSVHL